MVKRIDVHHHYIPPPYLEVFESQGLKDPSGWPMPKWTPELDVSFSKDQSVETSILSVTAPGPQVIQGMAAVKLARQINEYGASLAAKDPQKYGFFAAVPDPCEDMNAVVEEIRYSLETLKADGITLYSRYGNDNHYLGHPDLRPLWEELEKHQAVVFVHPTHTVDTNLVNPHLPMPIFDYCHETGRAGVDLLMSSPSILRTVAPHVKIILSHAGGDLPHLITRVATTLPDAGLTSYTSEQMTQDAQKFYYDTALSSNKNQLDLLLKFVGPERLLFGTDFPFAPRKSIDTFTRYLGEYEMDEGAREAINRGNALKMFPRLGEK